MKPGKGMERAVLRGAVTRFVITLAMRVRGKELEADPPVLGSQAADEPKAATPTTWSRAVAVESPRRGEESRAFLHGLTCGAAGGGTPCQHPAAAQGRSCGTSTRDGARMSLQELVAPA